jgi:hypothetical protein
MRQRNALVQCAEKWVNEMPTNQMAVPAMPKTVIDISPVTREEKADCASGDQNRLTAKDDLKTILKMKH